MSLRRGSRQRSYGLAYGLVLGGVLPARLDGAVPGSPMPANSSTADGVDLRLSLAFRFLPILTCRRVRFFQVWRVFDAMAGAFYQADHRSSICRFAGAAIAARR